MKNDNRYIHDLLYGIVMSEEILTFLKTKGIIKKDNKIDYGYIMNYITSVSLTDQCHCLGIDYINIEDELFIENENPELKMLEYYKKEGFDCIWTEGVAIFDGLKAMVLPVFKKLYEIPNIIGVSGPFYLYPIVGHAAPKFYANRNHRDDILDYLMNITKDDYLINYQEIEKAMLNFNGYQVIPEIVKLRIYDFLYEKRQQLAELCFENQKYGKGWPDLFVYKDGNGKLVEVKKNDKLTNSQIETIPELCKIGFRCEINKGKAKISNNP